MMGFPPHSNCIARPNGSAALGRICLAQLAHIKLYGVYGPLVSKHVIGMLDLRRSRV